ncbi:hypothetical protein Tsubulata_029810, partial [Turnera subulata]
FHTNPKTPNLNLNPRFRFWEKFFNSAAISRYFLPLPLITTSSSLNSSYFGGCRLIEGRGLMGCLTHHHWGNCYIRSFCYDLTLIWSWFWLFEQVRKNCC